MILSDWLDQLLAGGFLDSLKMALAQCALNAEMEHHLGHSEQAGDSRNGYGRGANQSV